MDNKTKKNWWFKRINNSVNKTNQISISYKFEKIEIMGLLKYLTYKTGHFYCAAMFILILREKYVLFKGDYCLHEIQITVNLFLLW